MAKEGNGGFVEKKRNGKDALLKRKRKFLCFCLFLIFYYKELRNRNIKVGFTLIVIRQEYARTNIDEKQLTQFTLASIRQENVKKM